MFLKIEDIGTTRSWDYSKPTLMSPGRYTHRPPTTNAAFCELFYGKFPALKNMKWDNIVIRGGAIIDMLLQRHPSDLDFFFYGLEPEKVLTRAHELVDYFLTAEKAHVAAENERRVKEAEKHGYHRSPHNVEKINITGVRVGPVVTLRLSAISRMPIQIVLAHHPSLESLVNSTDFAVSSVMFNGTDVLVSEAARFELENMSVIVKADNIPDQKRVEKYFHKGFDFIFPQMDVSKLPRHYLKLNMCDAIQTKGIAFSYSDIERNKITLDRFINLGGRRSSRSTEYDRAGSSALDARAVIYANIEMLCKGEKKFLVFAEADFVDHVLDVWPNIGPRQVENTFAGIKNSIFNDVSFDLPLYQKYVTQTSMKEVLMKMCDLSKMKSAHERKQPLHEAIDRQMDYCKEQILVLNEEFKDAKLSILGEDATFPKQGNLSHFYGDYLLVE